MNRVSLPSYPPKWLGSFDLAARAFALPRVDSLYLYIAVQRKWKDEDNEPTARIQPSSLVRMIHVQIAIQSYAARALPTRNLRSSLYNFRKSTEVPTPQGR